MSKFGKRQGNSALFVKQRRRVRDYLEWLERELAPYSARINDHVAVKKRPDLFGSFGPPSLEMSVLYTKQHPVFSAIREKWYPSGKKRVPLDVDLSPLTVAVWFMDDGSNDTKHRQAYFCTQSFTFSECDMLCSRLAALGVCDVVVCKDGDKKPKIRVKPASYYAFMDMIRPHFAFESMKYKVDTSVYYYGKDKIPVTDMEQVKLMRAAGHASTAANLRARWQSVEHKKYMSERLSKYYVMTHPDGREETIHGLRKFCLSNGINGTSCMSAIAKHDGIHFSCHGFTCRYATDADIEAYKRAKEGVV